MDGPRFDLWTRRRFGRVAGGFVGAIIASTARQQAAARKKRKKKRKPKSKPPRQICRRQQEACSSTPEEQCCSGLTCNDNSCVGDPICVQDVGGPCSDRCDCRLGLECSDRTGNTCRQCSLSQQPCATADDCRLNSSFCATNACFAPPDTFCCQGLGAACSAPCDCCPNPGNCGLDGCGGVEPVCCRGLGFPCESNCDCCDPLRCVNDMCQ